MQYILDAVASLLFFGLLPGLLVEPARGVVSRHRRGDGVEVVEITGRRATRRSMSSHIASFVSGSGKSMPGWSSLGKFMGQPAVRILSIVSRS